jgi:hypothetical protein
VKHGVSIVFANVFIGVLKKDLDEFLFLAVLYVLVTFTWSVYMKADFKNPRGLMMPFVSSGIVLEASRGKGI